MIFVRVVCIRSSEVRKYDSVVHPGGNSVYKGQRKTATLMCKRGQWHTLTNVTTFPLSSTYVSWQIDLKKHELTGDGEAPIVIIMKPRILWIPADLVTARQTSLLN